MIHRIVAFSLRNKPLILFLLLAWVVWGVTSALRLPLDATPDITNNQVQVVTNAPALAPQEMEAFVTAPLERSMLNLPGVEEVRSISRYGLSIITVVFQEDIPTLDARQLVREQLNLAIPQIPEGYGTPEILPMTTGLGEVYQYVLVVDRSHRGHYSLSDLRFMQDWDVKLGLAGIPGIVEVSSFGGAEKQWEVSLDPARLSAAGLDFHQVAQALQDNNGNSGGSYIARADRAFYIRADGLIKSLEDLKNIALQTPGGTLVRLQDLGQVGVGQPPRFGAMTMDGQGEVVGGITLMLKGANSLEVTRQVEKRVEQLNKSLPEGVRLMPYLNRADLVGRTTSTVLTNLAEGGLIVIFVLVLLLGQWRSGWVVASIIPLSLLFALGMMHLFGVSANLMSLGALDFGIVVDGAVIIVESLAHAMSRRTQSSEHPDEEVATIMHKVFRSAAFGVLIILVVLLPVLTLTGVEGKMFRPMVQTVSFALLGALILSVTYVPVVSSMWLTRPFKEWSLTARLNAAIERQFRPTLHHALRHPRLWMGGAVGGLVASVFLFRTLGAVFLPTLEEGDLAMQLSVAPGSTLEHSIATCTKAEQMLMEHFPEVKHVVSKIGTAEVPTDPMGIEDADVMIVLHPKDQWVSAQSREELADQMKEVLSPLEGAQMEFTQPIQLRFNELLTGSKSDLSIKIFGPDPAVLLQTAEAWAADIQDLPGVADLRVERTEGMNVYRLVPDRFKLSQYGFHVREVNDLIQTAFSGRVTGKSFLNDRSVDVVLRAEPRARENFDLSDFALTNAQGVRVPLSELVQTEVVEGPLQISREQGQRRISIGINVRNRDVESLVQDIQASNDRHGWVPPQYSVVYGGQFQNLRQARARLGIAVPLALGLILVLLYFAFGSMKYALLIFLAVPLSTIGGVLALAVRGMPFSISAGVGFIALFGVAVLNGIVLISAMNDLRERGMDLRDVLVQGPLQRLRPVLMTAGVAALGFLPMALSQGAGAEVQRPLATVVIGGLISATLLTLVVLPILYGVLERGWRAPLLGWGIPLGMFLLPAAGYSQEVMTVDKAVTWALQHNPELSYARLDADAARAEKQQAFAFAPLELEYQRGEINEPVNDYAFTIRQDFGSIWQHIRKSQAFQTAVEEREAELELRRRETEYNVRMSYESWMHACQREQIVSRDAERFSSMTDIIEVGYAAGDLSALDRATARGKLAQYKNLLTETRTTRAARERSFKHLLLYPDAFVEPPQWEALSAPLDTGLLALGLLEPAKLREALAKEQLRAEKAAYFPSLNVGYFNQSIALTPGFQGFSVGLSFPLWFRPTQGRIRAAKVRLETATLELETANQRLENLRREAFQQMWNLRQRLADYENASMEDADRLYDASLKAFQAGDTDVFRLFDAFMTVIQLKMEYLDLLEAYNLAVLRTRYLTDLP